MQHRPSTLWISKRHVAKHEARLERPGNGLRVDGFDDCPLQVKEFVEAGEEQAIFIETREAAQHLPQKPLAALKRLIVHD
jgi:hypothetical protein